MRATTTTSLFVLCGGLGLGLSLAACADADGGDAKPATDPDLVMTAAKADATTDWYTTMRGPIGLGETIHEEIDWPDYYLGRTLELRAGQKVEFKVTSNRKSIVRVYGPAYDVLDGQPLFKKAAVKSETKKQGGKQVALVTVEASAAGTYMLLYGPSNVWFASYDITASCVAGCLPADACASDNVCPGDEFCGWNGVACIRAPCDAAYDICQSRHDAGESCDRDRACAEGLRCGADGRCEGGTVAVGGACGVTSDCANGFCGCADASCSGLICKAFAKEGEVCGGFRPASSVTMCSPANACVAPYDIIADIPGHCGQMTTVAAVLADPKAFDGRYIAVKGLVDASAAFCTKLGCSPANPCCNQCGANLALFDDKAQMQAVAGITLEQDGAPLSCGGNECTWHDQCSVAPGNAWVSGWFSLVDGITPKLTIDRRYAF